MVSESSELKRFSHSLGQNWYYVVLIPKFRYLVFRQVHQRKLMIEAIDVVCSRHSIDLFTSEVVDDHVHLFVSCPPEFSIRKLAKILKGGTSFYVREHHQSLRRYTSLWHRGFMYRSVGAVNAEIVKRHINNSNHWINASQKRLV